MISVQTWADARLLWDYHRMRHGPRPCSGAVGLGSHDLGVADVTVVLYPQAMASGIVCTGATSPTTRARMPRGEAVALQPPRDPREDLALKVTQPIRSVRATCSRSRIVGGTASPPPGLP